MWALMRPTGRPSRRARKNSASACSKNGFWLRFSRLMNALRSLRVRTGRISTAMPSAYMPTVIDVFAKVRGHEREEMLRAAREADMLPYFRTVESPAMPEVEMESARRIMLASNNYLGLTSDERVVEGAEEALHRY